MYSKAMKNWLIKSLLAIAAVFTFLFGLIFSPLAPSAVAADDDGPTCGGVETSIIACDAGKDSEGGAIWDILNLVLQILTWGVGIAAVVGIVIAAIVYTTAGGDPAKTKMAKTMIFNIGIGLVLYVLLYAILNFILPNDLGSSSNNTTNGTTQTTDSVNSANQGETQEGNNENN